ncbi:hypothetical protein HDU92_008417 [Lobulomyces angularis]|nr:hypothetical protein HDU92_008417 [Lobulomyces angularis]
MSKHLTLCEYSINKPLITSQSSKTPSTNLLLSSQQEIFEFQNQCLPPSPPPSPITFFPFQTTPKFCLQKLPLTFEKFCLRISLLHEKYLSQHFQMSQRNSCIVALNSIYWRVFFNNNSLEVKIPEELKQLEVAQTNFGLNLVNADIYLNKLKVLSVTFNPYMENSCLDGFRILNSTNLLSLHLTSNLNFMYNLAIFKNCGIRDTPMRTFLNTVVTEFSNLIKSALFLEEAIFQDKPVENKLNCTNATKYLHLKIPIDKYNEIDFILRKKSLQYLLKELSKDVDEIVRDITRRDEFRNVCTNLCCFGALCCDSNTISDFKIDWQEDISDNYFIDLIIFLRLKI